MLPTQDSAVQSLVFLWGRKHDEGKPWSVEEEKQLREMVQEHKRLSEIAGFFGKSPASVKMKISRLKLVVVVRQIQHHNNYF